MSSGSIAIIGGADGPTAILGTASLLDVFAPAMGVALVGIVCICVIFYVKKRNQ